MTYFTDLATALLFLAVLRWCFLPHAQVPRFRVRYLRLRLRLRLHPGRGHATAFELWLRWGRLATFATPPDPVRPSSSGNAYCSPPSTRS